MASDVYDGAHEVRSATVPDTCRHDVSIDMPRDDTRIVVDLLAHGGDPMSLAEGHRRKELEGLRPNLKPERYGSRPSFFGEQLQRNAVYGYRLDLPQHVATWAAPRRALGVDPLLQAKVWALPRAPNIAKPAHPAHPWHGSGAVTGRCPPHPNRCPIGLLISSDQERKHGTSIGLSVERNRVAKHLVHGRCKLEGKVTRF